MVQPTLCFDIPNLEGTAQHLLETDELFFGKSIDDIKEHLKLRVLEEYGAMDDLVLFNQCDRARVIHSGIIARPTVDSQGEQKVYIIGLYTSLDNQHAGQGILTINNELADKSALTEESC